MSSSSLVKLFSILPLLIGIDIGTQGARIALLDEEGRQHCVKEEVFPFNTKSREEQSPLEWWDSCYRSLFSLCNEAKTSIDLSNIKAMSVTSTSGTIIPLDKDNQPLHDAIMYSDPRSADEAKLCKEAAVSVGYKGYSAFNNGIVTMQSRKAYLVGTMTSFKETYLNASNKLVGICFKSAAFSSFYNYFPLHEITNKTIEFESSLSPEIYKIEQRSISYLNEYFLKRLNVPKHNLYAVIQNIQQANGQIGIETLAKKIVLL